MAARPRLALLSLFLCMTPALAHADVPPAEGYVENCTKEKAEARTGTHCQLCGSAYHGDREACANEFAGGSLSKECQTSGASTWDEVWCDPNSPLTDAERAAAAEAVGPVSEDKGQRGCGCSAAPERDIAPFAGLAFVLGVFGLGLARRRG